MERDRDKADRPGDRKGNLGKRSHEGNRASDTASNLLHFRMLVAVKKAGSVIGKGGDFIQMTKSMTGAKVGVDKPVGQSDERMVHVQGFDEPSKPVAGVQEAALRTAERILGEETPSGVIKLPHKCSLRMLLFKYQIGAVMGKKGQAINEIRNKSGASVKLLSPQAGAPIVPAADADDELITIAGAPEQVLTALKMISDKLRGVHNPFGERGPWLDRGDRPELHDRRDRGAPGGPDSKRSRGPDRDDNGPGRDDRGADRGPPPGMAGPPWDPRNGPPGGRDGPEGPGGPSGGISLALPYAARGVFNNNDSVKTEGLMGLASVEYRIMVPIRRIALFLGQKGGGGGRERRPGIIKDIRIRTGAKLHVFDEEKGSPDRVLQIMSTEDVQDQHCAAFDAAMDCINALLLEELQADPVATVRMVVPQSQVGAIMGKGGSTINALRQVAGCNIHLSAFPDVPRSVKKGEEIMELRGAREAVLLASHIALVAIRGNMARGQLIYKHPVPQGAPPPTLRGPPPGMGPPPEQYGDRRDFDVRGGPGGRAGADSLQGGPADPRMQGAPPPGTTRGSRWDADARGLPHQAPPPQQQQQAAAGPGGPQAPGSGHGAPAPQGPPGALPGPAPGLPGPPVQVALPGQVPQVQAVYQEQGVPPQYAAQQMPQPSQQQPQQALTQPQVQYVQGPPPAGIPGQPQQVVVYTNHPLPAGYAPPAPQQVHVQQQGVPPGQAVEYTTTYMQGPPPVQQVVHQGPAPGQTVVYTNAPPPGQPYIHTDPNMPPPQQVTYIYTSAPPLAPAGAAAAPASSVPMPAVAGQPQVASSGPASSSGYGGLASIVGSQAAALPPATGAAPAGAVPAAAPAPVAVAVPAAPPQAAPAVPPPAPVAAPAPAPPKARVLLTQEQVQRLKLDDPAQCAQLACLSGASITLSDNVLENGAREVLLGGTDQQCNTVKNLMEALMRSS